MSDENSKIAKLEAEVDHLRRMMDRLIRIVSVLENRIAALDGDAA
jgi:exonuclease VII small subunit